MRLNNKVDQLKVGDQVTTDYRRSEAAIVRLITSIERHKTYGSGYRVCADGGKPCPCCGALPGKPITGSSGKGIDGSWFIPVKEAPK